MVSVVILVLYFVDVVGSLQGTKGILVDTSWSRRVGEGAGSPKRLLTQQVVYLTLLH